MNSIEILNMLKTGKISIEDAKKLILKSSENQNYAEGLVISSIHTIDELKLNQLEVLDPLQDEVQVEVKASAINFPDIMCIKGLYPTMPEYPFVPGFEVSGIVKSVGTNVKDIQVGDKVIAVTGDGLGGHSSIVNVKSNNCVLKPENISYEEGCSMPVAFGTVYYSFEKGNLKNNEKVLIQTATGACGLMAIQLASLKNAEIFATTSKLEKLRFLKELNIPHRINYATEEFDKRIDEITSKKGVDLVLNMLSGEAIQRGINSLGSNGRYLELAVHGLKTSPKLDLSKLVDNQIFMSIDLRRMTLNRKIQSKVFLEKMVEMCEKGEIVPIVSKIYPLSKYKEALKYVESGKHIGKVVLSHEESEIKDVSSELLAGLLEQREINKTKRNVLVEEARNDQMETTTSGIAIIGMAGQFPMAKNVDELWGILSKGEDGVSEVPPSRWDMDKYFSSNIKEKGKSYSKWMGYLEDGDKFDPLFFNISPSDAEIMDPQARLFLESCYHCFENAGILPSNISGNNCGVFVGCSTGEYSNNITSDELTVQHLMGKVTSMLSARIAYYLNLKGPSISIDTACSSSLVSIATACDSLLLKNCDMALSGGVTVLTNPNMHIMTSKGEMLSKKGKCSSFDNDADGFVPSEAVGVILLKRLEDAKRDKDNILGVIKGWGTNQDGKTNGITAPSSLSQSELEKSVYKRFNINPETISMVEAHGTGTKLGDPIEVEALTNSFREYTDNKNYSALTSIKSNIGHTLAAAGVSSVIKVLLSIKNKQIPPSINFNKINEHINIEESPFYISTELKAWEKVSGVRRSCVSGFGFSGTNAHLVIDEPEENLILNNKGDKPSNIFILSAQNIAQLKAYASTMKQYINLKKNLDLDKYLYTLQNNRESMECRLAIFFNERYELLELLDCYLTGTENNKIIQNVVKKRRLNELKYEGLISGLTDNELVNKWLNGYSVEWKGSNKRENSITIPNYPFKRESYWINKVDNKKVTVNEITKDYKFNGNEYFLSDHIINDNKVLPGVGYFELLVDTLIKNDVINLDKDQLKIKEIKWIKPFIFSDKNNHIKVSISNLSSDTFSFEMFNYQVESKQIYCSGFGSILKNNSSKIMDLSNYNKSIIRKFDSHECYDIFKENGINYGEAFRTINSIKVNDTTVIVDLEVTKTCQEIVKSTYLPIGILDGALQGVLGAIDINNEKCLLLPFSIDEVNIYAKCESSMKALLTRSNIESATKDVKYDVQISNLDGELLIEMKGYYPKRIYKESTADKLLYVEPVYNEKNIINNRDCNAMEEKHLIILGKYENQEGLKSLLPLFNIKLVNTEVSNIKDKIKYYGKTLISFAQELLRKRTKVNIQILCMEDEEEFIMGSLEGMLKTITLESKLITIQQLILNNKNIAVEDLSDKITKNMNDIFSNYIEYRNNKRLVKNYREISSIKNINIPWRENGVYVIFGGAKGIGYVLAEDICRRLNNVNVIVLGRSNPSDVITEALAKLNTNSNKVSYLKCDISNKEEVSRSIKLILNNHGTINGVIQCAGIIKDSLLINKNQEDIDSVIEPKIDGTINIDLATLDIKLDFFILYSSMAGVFGNIGQIDYSFGNSFLNAFACYRQNLVEEGKREGNTLAISWPLWKDGGMQIDENKLKYINKTYGIETLPSREGLDALYFALGSCKPNMTILYGDKESIRNNMPIKENNKLDNIVENKTQNNREKIKNDLIGILSNILKISEKEIDLDMEFSDFGFDSISFTQISDEINNLYGLDVTPALFFKYYVIDEFLQYLYECNIEILEPENLEDNLEEYFDEVAIESKEEKSLDINNDVAIIGLSCKFPKAKDADEFWNLLKNGEDCITEIPKERWDWKEFYGNYKEEDKTNIIWGGFIDGIDEFDPEFFGISPKEAELMDPQQRLLMTYVWKALEDAGYSNEKIAGTDTSLIIATGSSNYNKFIYENHLSTTFYGTTGMVPSVGPNKMSYFLNIHGISEPVETACSSSLVAIHKGVEEIRNKNSSMAIVGGINTLVTPDLFISFSKAGMLAPDGKCKTFSSEANGYVRSEGIGMLVLKDLKQAQNDGDNIYAVIKGTSVNHGGKANSFTSPNPKAQADLIERTIRKSGIDPRTIGYIEAHGTGTKIGDPIEINGLTMAFDSLYKELEIDDKNYNYCGLGAVKTNMGHSELAAGMAGVIKVILQMKNKSLASTLHCTEVNPYIKLKETPFYIVNETKHWDRFTDNDGIEIPRRAGVSSFGFGGVNGHVILEEYETNQKPLLLKENERVLIVLSAKSRKVLGEQLLNLLTAINDNKYKDSDLINMSYTLQCGRTEMNIKMGFIVNSISQFKDKLEDLLNNDKYLEVCSEPELKKHEIDINSYKRNYEEILNLWLHGYSMTWSKLYEGLKTTKLSLPTYPFIREKYWINKENIPEFIENKSREDKKKIKVEFHKDEFLLKDHIINGNKVLPGVTIIEIVQDAFKKSITCEDNSSITIKDLYWSNPIMLQGEKIKLNLELKNSGDNQCKFSLYENEDFVLSSGIAIKETQNKNESISIDNLLNLEGLEEINTKDFYSTFNNLGICYGENFKVIDKMYRFEDTIITDIVINKTIIDTLQKYYIHPSLADGILQSVCGFFNNTNEIRLQVPFHIEKIEIIGPTTKRVIGLLKIKEQNSESLIVDIDVFNEIGELIIRITSLEYKNINKKRFKDKLQIVRPEEELYGIFEMIREGKVSLEQFEKYVSNKVM